MELQVVNKQMRRQDWVEMVTSYCNSGLTVETWCQANGISVGTYYYRQKQVCSLVTELDSQSKANFVQLGTTSRVYESAKSPITLQMGEINVSVEAGVDRETLTTGLQSIGQLC